MFRKCGLQPEPTNQQAERGRGISFVMKNNLAIYGGFVGTENQLSQRNWTILIKPF